jgi:hypothetical protein
MCVLILVVSYLRDVWCVLWGLLSQIDQSQTVILRRGHLFKLGKVNNPICRRCYLETETASHVLCDGHYLGRHCLNPGDYQEISLSKIVCFIAGTGLLADL